MTRHAFASRSATYRQAVQWIADNDNPADAEPAETVAGYLTVCLVADLYDVDQYDVARDVVALRGQ